jgi:hypothetical protein
MKSALVLLIALLFPSLSWALGPGTYVISFRISDMGFQQAVELKNFRESPNGAFVGFDVHLDQQGSLKRFPPDSQLVQGVVYDGKFRFILPFANVTSVYGFNFVGTDEEVDGAYRGSGHVFLNDSEEKDTFDFRMRRADR